MRRKALITLGILFAAIQPLGADAPQMRGALVTDLTINPNDSLLVRAAKMTVASRAAMTMHSTRVIDNDSLRQIASAGHFSVATTEVSTPAVLGPSSPAPVSPYQQQNTQTFPVAQPSRALPPVMSGLPPPPQPTNPTPYRPPQ